jgi:hypothetical protein
MKTNRIAAVVLAAMLPVVANAGIKDKWEGNHHKTLSVMALADAGLLVASVVEINKRGGWNTMVTTLKTDPREFAKKYICTEAFVALTTATLIGLGIDTWHMATSPMAPVVVELEQIEAKGYEAAVVGKAAVTESGTEGQAGYVAAAAKVDAKDAVYANVADGKFDKKALEKDGENPKVVEKDGKFFYVVAPKVDGEGEKEVTKIGKKKVVEDNGVYYAVDKAGDKKQEFKKDESSITKVRGFKAAFGHLRACYNAAYKKDEYTFDTIETDKEGLEKTSDRKKDETGRLGAAKKALKKQEKAAKKALDKATGETDKATAKTALKKVETTRRALTKIDRMNKRAKFQREYFVK